MVIFLFNVFVIRIGGCGMEFVTVFAIQMSPVALEVVICFGALIQSTCYMKTCFQRMYLFDVSQNSK